ncbi:uncharacterized protein CELE_B0361.14 [Caenorhabditis elegans]|uniref:Uncharacterized protein n=1 Tax=Caenorhabditis elegans TaxID=6239 RepID=A0A2K5ATT1_CAEEL|nr:Uncharacterized protein CELE_B0361.14 [Caenorhabditis elegans]SPC47525.2 Uncharacterized protein CELE_B0361.14 [Caenorhabditis elegans]|eukprot:NP_001348730.2 Uncharacterized protein CELE_B0361.14 [Caenorhabditis elegans]
MVDTASCSDNILY